MLYTLKLFILGCFVSFVVSQTTSDQPLPPRNVSLTWTDEFRVKFRLSWTEPERFNDSCMFLLRKNGQVKAERWTKNVEYTSALHLGLRAEGLVKEERFSVQTQCSEQTSDPVVRTFPAPVELVKDLRCFISSPRDMTCSWVPARPSPGLQVHYWFPSNKNSAPSALKTEDCQVRDGVRTACHLKDDMLLQDRYIYILLNDTLNGTSVRNTFIFAPKNNVRLPPLNWTVKEEGDLLHLSWVKPALFDPECWRYIVNYTSCTESAERTIIDDTTTTVPYTKHCGHHLRMRAEGLSHCGLEGTSTPWGLEKTVNASSLNFQANEVMIYVAAVTIPLLVSIFVLVCVRRHKDKIFPKVPDPTNIFQDMVNNNNEKSAEVQLYVPCPEQEDCLISLVQQLTPDQPEH